MKILELTQTDKFIYANEIKPYLPKQIFDAHTHIQIPKYHPNLEQILPITKDPMLNTIDMEAMNMWWKSLFPDSDVSGLILGLPTRGCDIDGINSYLAQNVDRVINRFSILTSPDMSDYELEKQINELKPAGLKPYMCFSKLKNFNDSGICDLIPESQVALADKYHLKITLHVAKPRGMADDDNISEINRLTKKYQSCNFILAHCGRCFISPNMEYAIKRIEPANNLWFDTSAVCDTGVFLYLFRDYNRKNILFGTDLVTATGFRGTYVRMGMLVKTP